MTSKHVLSRVVIFATLAAMLGVASCSKGGSPTAPDGDGGGAGSLFNLGPFALGQSARFTFANAGTVGYHCIPHRSMGMIGTVQVDAGGSDSVVVQISSANQFVPSAVHIKPGGYVRWVNSSGSTEHTVTSS
jgi:plastocyanin